MKRGIYCSTFLALFFITSLSHAHHSRSNFLLDQTVEMEGVVSRFQYANPHVYVYFTTEADGDNGEEWIVELGSIPLIKRMHIDAHTFKQGDEIIVRANPDRNPRKKYLLIDTITKKATGERYAMEDIFSYGAKVRKSFAGKPGSKDFTGIWSIEKARTDILAAARNTPQANLTDLGRATLATFDPDDNPFYRCIPEGLPRRIGSVYPMIIERDGDKLLIKDEISPDYRTVYLNDAAPDKLPQPSRLGFSRGRLEDNVLIIETDDFIAEQWGIAPGLDSSAQKRLRERYWMEDNNRELHVEVTVEDPVYLSKPFTTHYLWKFAPAIVISDYSACDPDSAAKHLQFDG